MWQTWLNGSTLPALEQATVFAEKRHLLLAGNIANIDTPDYQTRDVSVDDFQSTLKEALTNPRTQAMPGSTETGTSLEQVRDVSRQVLYHDGSDVSLEQQVTEISKNQGMHNMAIALMRSQFQSLEVAIRESVAV